MNDLQFGPGETLLAIAGRSLGVCDLAQPGAPRLVRSDGRNYGTVRFSPAGETLLVVTGESAIEARDIHSGIARFKTCCSSIYGEVAFTPDGRAIANGGHRPAIRDGQAGQIVARLTGERAFHAFGPIAFDPTRGTILMGSQDGRVHVWDLAARQPVAISPTQPNYVDALAVMAGGWVVYGAFGKPLRLWNPQTGERRSWPSAVPASNLVPAPGGDSIVFGTADGRIEIWDIRAGRRLDRLTLTWP